MNYFLKLLIIIICFTSITTNSQTWDANKIEMNYGPDGNPEDFIKSESGFYFTANDGVLDRRALFFSDGTLNNTRLVLDINEDENDPFDINPIATIGNMVFVNVGNHLLRPQLWVTDGTPEGGMKLGDVFAEEMIIFKNKAYFSAIDHSMEIELWVSDGTPEGTHILKDIVPGDKSSHPSNLFIFKDKLFFTAIGENNQREIWKSDGTEAGTEILIDINAQGHGVYDDNDFLQYSGHFFFLGNHETYGYELYKSDGSKEGTGLVKNIYPTSNANWNLKGVSTDNGIFFGAYDENGEELWVSDGTEAGTRLVKDINTEMNGIGNKMVVINNTVFFLSSGNDGTQLWETEGSSESTSMVLDLTENFYSIHDLEAVNGKVLFVASETINSFYYLYTTDGTEEGTYKISEEKVRPDYSHFDFSVFEYEEKVYFATNSEIYGNELWKSDLTRGGSSLFKDFDYSDGVASENAISFQGLLSFNGNKALYLSNGSVEGTRSIQASDLPVDHFKPTSKLYPSGETIYFRAVHAEEKGQELWKSDGTAAGTKLVKDIWEGPSSGINTEDLNGKSSGNDFYFVADDGVHGNELWYTDGTEEGTIMLKDIYPDFGDSYPNSFYFFQGELYFNARSNTGTSIWKSDGTSAGTTNIGLQNKKLINTVNDRLIMYSSESNSSSDNTAYVWSSDGTESNTTLIQTLTNGFDSRPLLSIKFNNEVYYVANNDNWKPAIYKTNGVEGDVELIFEIQPEMDVNNIVDFFTCGGELYFLLERDRSKGWVELWRSDGTPGNTKPVNNYVQGADRYFGDVECFKDNFYVIEKGNSPGLVYTNSSLEKLEELNFTVEGEAVPEDLIIKELKSAGNVLYFWGETTMSGQELYSFTKGELIELPTETTTVEIVSTDIFEIKIADETCANKNNGRLSINSTEDFQFVADLNGDQFNFTSNLEIENLSPGSYDLCITMESNLDFKQCFNFNINPGGSIEGRMQLTSTPKSENIRIDIRKGTGPFFASLNGEIIGEFKTRNFEIDAEEEGLLEVYSSKACEGKLTLQLNFDNSLVAYPNPAESVLNIAMPGSDISEVKIEVYNTSMQLMSSRKYKVTDNIVNLDVQNYSSGFYYAILNLDLPTAIKFFKK